MPEVVHNENIAANGTYTFPVYPTIGAEMLVEWDIHTGSATVTPGYMSLTGLFKPALNADGTELTQGEGGGLVRLDVPPSGVVALKVEAAAGGFAMKAFGARVLR